ncbi:SEPSECS [Cordylochernes scorpioides]|uniref:SEPSECS n=1 Tax=Cordylochernes scorpioides TaxID=51811 RepID=A0ABY6JW76_9ARAC|nr:SEPSECS [Cordylochernes scorpioides]
MKKCVLGGLGSSVVNPPSSFANLIHQTASQSSNTVLDDSAYIRSTEGWNLRNGFQENYGHKRKCPKEGWDDSTINALIQQLAAMDSNNYLSSCGVGEREARFASDIVSARHFKLELVNVQTMDWTTRGDEEDGGGSTERPCRGRH